MPRPTAMAAAAGPAATSGPTTATGPTAATAPVPLESVQVIKDGDGG